MFAELRSRSPDGICKSPRFLTLDYAVSDPTLPCINGLQSKGSFSADILAREQRKYLLNRRVDWTLPFRNAIPTLHYVSEL